MRELGGLHLSSESIRDGTISEGILSSGEESPSCEVLIEGRRGVTWRALGLCEELTPLTNGTALGCRCFAGWFADSWLSRS